MFSCGDACGGSDPTSDTVKVDPALLAAAGKENAQPKNAVPEKAHEAQKALQEQRRRQEELKAAEERRKLEEKAKKMRVQQANRRREEEEQERQAAELERVEREAAAAAQAKEEEQVRLEKARVAQEKVRADHEAAEKAAKEEADRKAAEQVAAWCKKNGFKDMNTERKGFMSGSKLPLHVAVTNKDAEMVRLMVQLGVDKTAKNSKGQTATDLAMKLDKDYLILASLR